jgi:hypothetical protein
VLPARRGRAGINRFARFFHRVIQQPYRGRKLLAVRANHIQRHHVSLIVRQQHPQPPFADIIADVEFRLERDALPGNRQAAITSASSLTIVPETCT